MKINIDVRETAVTGGLWHAQTGLGVFASQPSRTGAMGLATPGYVSTLAPNAAIKASAKRAPQSRGSSAHM